MGFCAFLAVFERFCTGFTETSCANHTGNPCTLSQIARVFRPLTPNHTEPVWAVERWLRRQAVVVHVHVACCGGLTSGCMEILHVPLCGCRGHAVCWHLCSAQSAVVRVNRSIMMAVDAHLVWGLPCLRVFGEIWILAHLQSDTALARLWLALAVV
jgi:hypothetical protein